MYIWILALFPNLLTADKQLKSEKKRLFVTGSGRSPLCKKVEVQSSFDFLHFIKPQLCLFLVIQTKLDSSTNLLKADIYYV